MRNTHVIQPLLATMIILWVSSLMNTAVAQSLKDTTLHEVKVKAKRAISADSRVNDFSPGQKIKTIDSATLQQYRLQSIAGLLTQQVPVFVRSYGFNGLATLSFRGASAAQSAVYWNGVPIQNAALGIADVSTLPVLFMNNVNIVYGGSAALWGSGNVGGALLLENAPPVFDTNKHNLSLSGGIGSFNQYITGIKGSILRRRWCFAANIFGQTAKNNFPYTNEAGIKTTMSNSRLQSGAALLQAAYKISAISVVGLSAWYQLYDREIPPALFEPASQKKEKDGSFRLLADWSRNTLANTWYAKTSFIRDETIYTDPAIAILARTDNIAYQYYQEMGWKKQLRRYGQILLFMPVQISWIGQPNTNTAEHQNKVALAAAYDIKLLHNKLGIAANAREEMINGKGIFSPGADASYLVTHWLSLRGNAQYTYRAPTLNELYYNPGGNSSLKPEYGWNEDAGYTVKFSIGRCSVYHDLSLFNRNIHDWILWLGGAIWTPHNIAAVHSRGTETENSLTCALGKWQLRIGINTAYILSTTVSSYIQNDGSIGKQIPYAPRYNGQLNVGFCYARFSFNYDHTYTGYRFITADESEYISPYQTGNLQLMYSTLLYKHQFRLTAQCNNVWNEHYQVVAFRPMPGINWLLGFSIAFFGGS